MRQLPRAACEASEVRVGHGGRRLHLDAGELVSAALEDDVDLVAIAVPEVMEAQVVIVPARQTSQLLQDERLQELTERWSIAVERGRRVPEQGAGDSGVADVELRGLDQSAHSVAVPRRQLIHQEQAFEEGDVVSDGRTAEMERCAEIADVDERRGVGRGRAQQSRNHIEGADASELPHVALNQRLDVVLVPTVATTTGGACERGGEASGDDDLCQRGAESIVRARAKATPEEAVEERRCLACDLALREGEQGNQPQPAGKRVRERRQEQDVGRPGEVRLYAGQGPANRKDEMFDPV